MKPDSLALLEAIYRTESDEAAWLADVATQATSLYDRGLGAATFLYSKGAAAPVIDRLHFSGAFQPEWLINIRTRMGLQAQAVSAEPAGWQRWFHMHVGTVRTTPGLEAMASALSEFGGARDVFAFSGRNPGDYGVWFGAPDKRVVSLPPARHEFFTRIATHLAAGLRIRRKLAGAAPITRAEAVLTPDGKVVHAEAAAQSEEDRAELRLAALRVDRARSIAGRKDEEAATQAWRGLVSGRWTLLDQFESDGKRFVVATQNEVALDKPRPLSARERQVLAFAALDHTNKQIAYDLGLSAATVRVLMARAAQKLGVRLRRDAIAKFRALQLK